MSLFVLVFLTVVAVVIFDWIRLKLRYKKYMVGIPGPTALPIFGCALDFASSKDVFAVGFKYILTYGYLIRGNLAHMEFLFVSDLKWIEYFMTSPRALSKSSEYSLLENWLGKGLLTSTGTKWQKARKLLTPSFHFNNLDQFIDSFHSNSDILIEKLGSEVGNASTDIYSYVTLCTLDIISESIMGISVNAQRSENSDYVNSVQVMKEMVYIRTMSMWKTIDFLYPLSSDYWREKEALKVLHNTTDNVIKKRRQFLLTENNKENKKCTTFLDILLKGKIDGNSLTDQEIREQVDTFMFEGHDTTSSAVCFTLLCLAKHQDVQEKVVNELRGIFGQDKKKQATSEDLQNMNYLNLVIKETLRLFPSVPIIARTLDEDVEFEGKLLPKGLHVLMGLFGNHKNMENHDKPEEFIPERFNSENWSGKNPYTYTPFSAGFRNCIGQKFAMLELKAIVSKILRHYRIHAIPEYLPNIKVDVILKTDNGFPIRLEHRK